MSKVQKTNALRKLDAAGIDYEIKTYAVEDENFDGMLIVPKIGLPPEQIYKTLVLHGERTGHLVCCVPVDKELDLKKVAAAAKDKKVEMIHVKDLLPLTGYVRGGCSPVGMKKAFPTWMDKSILGQSHVAFSAGQRGMQMVVDVQKLLAYLGAQTAPLTI